MIDISCCVCLQCIATCPLWFCAHTGTYCAFRCSWKWRRKVLASSSVPNNAKLSYLCFVPDGDLYSHLPVSGHGPLGRTRSKIKAKEFMPLYEYDLCSNLAIFLALGSPCGLPNTHLVLVGRHEGAP